MNNEGSKAQKSATKVLNEEEADEKGRSKSSDGNKTVKSNLDYIAQIKAIFPKIQEYAEQYGEEYGDEEYYREGSEADSTSVESIEFKTISGQIGKMYQKKKKKIQEIEIEPSQTIVKDESVNLNELKEKLSVISVTDVQLDGWMSKEEFKRLKLLDMKSIVRQIEELAKFNREEVKLFEHTFYRIEIREREIDSKHIVFDYQFPWKGSDEMEFGPRICKTDPPTPVEPYLTPEKSDDEETEKQETEKEETEKDGEYEENLADIRKRNRRYIPIDLSKTSTDSFYDDMTLEEKNAAEKYIMGIGELAPDNFDVMRYNYGKLVDGVNDETQINAEKFNHAYVMYSRDCKFSTILKSVKKTILDRHDYFNKLKERDEKTRGDFINKIKLPDFIDPETGSAKTYSAILAIEAKKKIVPYKIYKDPKRVLADKDLENRLFRIHEISVALSKDDEELPGFLAFQINNAKYLPIAEKLRYALMEEAELKKEFQEYDVQGLKSENDIKMFIDMEYDVVTFMKKHHEELNHVGRCGRHNLSNKIRAEKITIFRNKFLKQMLSLKSKVMIAFSELNKVKRKVDLEYKRNNEYGESIQVIDFEWLKISNSNFIDDYEEQNVQLNGLKLITGRCFEVLKEWRTALEATEKEFSRIDDDKITRRGLNYSLKINTKRCKVAINEFANHNEFLRRRLRIFKAPSTLEYVKLQAMQNNITEEIELLKNKMESVNLSLSHERKTFKHYKGTMTHEKLVHEQNENWLRELRLDLEMKGLSHITNEMHDEDEKRIKRCITNIRLKKEQEKDKRSLFHPVPKNPLKIALYRRRDDVRNKKEKEKDGSNLNKKLANIENRENNKYKRKLTLHAMTKTNV